MKMKTARLAVLSVALAAGIGAAVLANGSKSPEIPPAPPPPLPTDGVLVAAKELNFNAVVDASDLRWEDWRKDNIPEGFVRKSALPDGIEKLKGYYVCSNFQMGEPLRRECLTKDPHSGFLAKNLPAGSRARWRSISTRKVQARLVGLSCQKTEST